MAATFFFIFFQFNSSWYQWGEPCMRCVFIAWISYNAQIFGQVLFGHENTCSGKSLYPPRRSLAPCLWSLGQRPRDVSICLTVLCFKKQEWKQKKRFKNWQLCGVSNLPFCDHRAI